jgi:hypothetical protein
LEALDRQSDGLGVSDTVHRQRERRGKLGNKIGSKLGVTHRKRVIKTIKKWTLP